MAARLFAARNYQAPDAPERAIVDRAIPAVTRAFAAALGVGRRLLDSEDAARMLRERRYDELVASVDWRHASEAMRKPLGMVAAAYAESAQLGVRKINGAFGARRRPVRFGAAMALRKDQADQFNFDLFSPQSVARIKALQDALIVELSADSRNVVLQLVLQGIREGTDPAELIARLQAVIGLTESQANAVLRYRAQLQAMDSGALARALMKSSDKAIFREAVAAGRQLTEAVIDQMTANYARAYLAYRAATIARTELTRAGNLGLLDSYLQAVARGVFPAEAVTKHWKIALDERTCPHCRSVVARNPDGVPLLQPFQSEEGPVEAPGLHPSCRCNLSMELNLDLVPAG